MKFLVDAQLPRRLAYRLNESGHEALHTLDLPDGNATPDRTICALAAEQQQIVVTKDMDFVDSFLLHRMPPKLLTITTGNISNSQLEALFLANLGALINALSTADYVELSRTAIIVHE
jgi:predicted nuclease of predicted toxin-antitoxin system